MATIFNLPIEQDSINAIAVIIIGIIAIFWLLKKLDKNERLIK